MVPVVLAELETMAAADLSAAQAGPVATAVRASKVALAVTLAMQAM